MADAYAALSSLRLMLNAERVRTLEILADGRPEDKHWELVGRAKGLKWTIEKLGEQIRSINGGDDGDNPT